MNSQLYIKKNNICYSLPYEIIKSNRKSIGIEIKQGGCILVRIPKNLTKFQMDSILDKKQDWILETYLKQKDTPILRKETSSNPQLQYLEKQYKKAAAEYIPKRVEYFISLTGGNYFRITIRDQKTRWGSCSSNGTLSFNWRLMLAPPHVLDYVVVHELCHLTYMNHSRDFWGKVEDVIPDYKIHKKWLKENGGTLILS